MRRQIDGLLTLLRTAVSDSCLFQQDPVYSACRRDQVLAGRPFKAKGLVTVSTTTSQALISSFRFYALMGNELQFDDTGTHL